MIGTTQKQADIFLTDEGDNWFQRNRSALAANSFLDRDIITRVLQSSSQNIQHVLEIGCGNGQKLQQTVTALEAEGFGIDPSEQAILHGSRQFPHLALEVATAADLPYADNSFDLVCFGFCLYLVDREDLYRVIAEADRVLKPQGYLAIIDFDPVLQHKREYHHKPGVYSYKTQYADYFTVGGHYALVSKDSFSHGNKSFTEDNDERVSVSILYKEPDPYPLHTS